jgi:hypothetical protein
VTYIPSSAPVRAKALFASTRATLVKELGIEGGTLFATEAAEILEPKEWEGRDKSSTAGAADEALLTSEERELQGVKRAEDEERHGTKGLASHFLSAHPQTSRHLTIQSAVSFYTMSRIYKPSPCPSSHPLSCSTLAHQASSTTLGLPSLRLR